MIRSSKSSTKRIGLGRALHRKVDWVLLTLVALICCCGLINLHSVGASTPGLRDLATQQVYWIAIGGFVCAVIASIDYRFFERNAWFIYGFGVALLVLVLLVGTSIRGSVRWIYLGPVSLQPSELMKVIIVVALAKYIHQDVRTVPRTLRDLIVPAAIIGVPALLILAQPDLGTGLVVMFISLSVMLLLNVKRSSVLTLVGVAVAALPLAWFYGLHDYQKERVITHIDRLTGSNKYVLESGWHTHQSLVAIGSGGFFGKGIGEGTQNRMHFLPDRHSDFPFAVWSEETGWLGAMALVALYAALVLWSLKIASESRDRFGSVMAVGIAAYIFWASVINIGMVTGLMPVVGMPLPLFSYGGSNMMTTMFAIGVLLSISMRRLPS